MNARGAEALYEAERQGVRHLKFVLTDLADGYCAGGILLRAAPGGVSSWYIEGALEFYEMSAAEWSEMVRLNNREGLSFSGIARKLGPDSA